MRLVPFPERHLNAAFKVGSAGQSYSESSGKEIAMKKILVGLAIVTVFLALTTLSFAFEPSVAGTWKVSVSGHDGMSIQMVLKQKGAKVTGVFQIPQHGDLDIEGQFVSGNLTVASDENGY